MQTVIVRLQPFEDGQDAQRVAEEIRYHGLISFKDASGAVVGAIVSEVAVRDTREGDDFARSAAEEPYQSFAGAQMDGGQCPWQIRWGTKAETTTRCDQPAHAGNHEGPGIIPGQRIHWGPGDRREYTGEWPGYCDKIPLPPFDGGCVLPLGHLRRCAP